MAGTLIELHGSRTFEVNSTGGSAKFLYFLFGEPDEATAYEIVKANSPTTWYGYIRDKINMDNRPTLGQWYPVVNYTLPVYQINSAIPGELPGQVAGTDTAPSASPSSGSPADNEQITGVSISISLESQHVTSSRKTIFSAAVAGFTPPDFKQLVNVSKGKVEGTDIGVPKARIVKKAKLPYLTAGYFRNLLYICGKTNEEPWWIATEEELLLVGVNGQDMGTGGFEANYEFDYVKTRYGLDVRGDGTLIVPEKRGHHYLWTANFPEKDAAANCIVERPRSANVEQMYDTIPFTWLGI